MGRKRKYDPNFVQTELFEHRKAGRPRDTGRKYIIGVDGGADNTRRGRSIWTTTAENALLKEIWERIKAGDTNIMLQVVIDDYLDKHTDVHTVDNK